MKVRASRLHRSFFARDPSIVARELLGCVLIRKFTNRRRISARIVETEAYGGRGDRASHAYRGRTPRNAVMFGPPGRAYVYFTYGMHWLFNVVTQPAGTPSAVLIRGVEIGKRDGASVPVDGPARVTKALRITGALNDEDLVRSSRLFLFASQNRADRRIRRTPRVGVDYAGHAAQWRRRYVLAPNART